MDIRKVKKLIELLEESGIGEIEIKEGEEAVRISRGVSGAPASQPYPAYNPGFAPPPPPPSAAAPAAPAAVEPAPAESSEGSGHIVRSPMVGTFYRSPSPSSVIVDIMMDSGVCSQSRSATDLAAAAKFAFFAAAAAS